MYDFTASDERLFGGLLATCSRLSAARQIQTLNERDIKQCNSDSTAKFKNKSKE